MKILGLAGKKGAGKDSIAQFLIRNEDELLPDYINSPSHQVQSYAMADELKRVCVDLLGLREEQVYGTNEQKNSPTHLRWEDLPHYPRLQAKWLVLDLPRKEGWMTAREVMQHVGTEVFRAMWVDCHVNATLNKIRRDGSALAVITDIRMPNEVDAVLAAGGKVVRLTRNPYAGDTHESELLLDPDRYDWSTFSAVVDNAALTLTQTCEEVVRLLRHWEFMP